MAQRRPSSLIKGLLVPHDLAKLHPNSGSVMRALTEFQKKLVRVDSTKEQGASIVAIMTDPPVKTPRAFPLYASILSKLFSFLSESEKDTMISRIQAKFLSLPHAGQLDLWLQRFTMPSGLAVDYLEPLTRAVLDPSLQLWTPPKVKRSDAD